jgi:tripartite-type tricarboxylate transporter receptor subunit TctC
VPEVATAREQGHPDLTFEGTVGLYGPRDMTAEIKRRIVTDVSAIVADPAFRARAESVGTAPRKGTPEEFAAAIEEQRAKIAAIHATIGKR